MSRRLIRKLWPLLLLFPILFTITLLELNRSNFRPETLRDDWVSVRLKDDQHEYVDSRGLHVVVGHYQGDINSVGSPNLTDEIINSNNYSPIANAGKDGLPVILPAHLFEKSRQLFNINKFNLMASDRIPLNRSLPDVRLKKCIGKYTDIVGLPKTSIIIVFHNEAWSTLLRTVWSVINRSPHSLLQEIILVDDGSTRKFLGKELEDYVKTLPIRTRILRTGTRDGLIRARILGAKKATGHILTFLDSHCECTEGWLEPLISRVAEDRTRVVCPIIDIISQEYFAYIRSFTFHWGAFDWGLQFRWYPIAGDVLKKRKLELTEPFSTPAMAGGLFSMDKNYFFEIGAYDDKMKIWGGENVEMSFRIWQCGGSIEIAPCSHVGHIFRSASPYSFPGGVINVLFRNFARVALVWLDEWKEFFFKFESDANPFRDEAIRSRLELRKQLNCKGFRWYLNNVWPQHNFPMEDKFFGYIKNVARDECLEKPTPKGNIPPKGPALLAVCTRKPDVNQMFVSPFDTSSSSGNIETKGSIATDESVCLDAYTKGDSTDGMINRVKITACLQRDGQNWKYSSKTKSVVHLETGLCLDLPPDESLDKGLVLNSCVKNSTTQQWIFEPVQWR